MQLYSGDHRVRCSLSIKNLYGRWSSAATTTVRRAFISGGLPGPIRDVEPAEPLDRDREGHTTGGEPKRSGPDCLVHIQKSRRSCNNASLTRCNVSPKKL